MTDLFRVRRSSSGSGTQPWRGHRLRERTGAEKGEHRTQDDEGGIPSALPSAGANMVEPKYFVVDDPLHRVEQAPADGERRQKPAAHVRLTWGIRRPREHDDSGDG